MILKFYVIMFSIIFLKHLTNSQSRDLTERTSLLDSFLSRFLYRSMRNLTLLTVGRTGRRTAGTFLQEAFEDDDRFPCDTSLGKSREIPQSVHKLRPGDISVISAIGDSLTAASGASSQSFADLFVENRGLSWSIGGQWNWRNATTLPNILKMFNPKLLGYSMGDSLTFHYESQFNIAEIGAVSNDMPYMAKSLVKRIRNDPRINFKKDWKMVTLCIGGNDFCTFVCSMKDPESLPRKHKRSLLNALRYLRDNMPRTYVNIVSTPPVDVVVSMLNKPDRCARMHHLECSCWIGHLYNQSADMKRRMQRIQNDFTKVEEDVAKMKEFRSLKDFAVVYQPFTQNFSVATKTGKVDLSLLSYDCFHMSQKGHSWAGTALWNNLLQPDGKKQQNWSSPHGKFLCPSKQHPYIYTYDNNDNI